MHSCFGNTTVEDIKLMEKKLLKFLCIVSVLHCLFPSCELTVMKPSSWKFLFYKCVYKTKKTQTHQVVLGQQQHQRRKPSAMQILGYGERKTTILKKSEAPGKVSLWYNWGEVHTLWHNSHLDSEMFPLEAFQKWRSLPHYLTDSMILSKASICLHFVFFCLLMSRSVVDADYFLKVSEKTLKSVVIQSLCMLCVAGHVWLESQLGPNCE